MKKILLCLFLSPLFFPCISQNTRKVLVEEFTSALVPYAPDSRARLSGYLNSPNVIHVGIYGFSTSDPLKCTDCGGVDNIGVHSWPAAYIDRMGSFATYTSILTSRVYYHNAINSRLTAAPKASISMTSYPDFVSRTCSLDISVTITDSISSNDTLSLTVYVIEDTVIGSGLGYDQANYYNNVGGHQYSNAGNPILNFPHINVVRKIIPAGNNHGDKTVFPLNPPVNSSYRKGYTFTMDSSWNMNKISYVAFVSHHEYYANSTTYNNYEVLNAEKISLSSISTANREIANINKGFIVYPNPAKDYLNIIPPDNFNYHGMVYNSTGQLVMEVPYLTDERVKEIDISPLPKGLYFIQFKSNLGTIETKKVLIE